MSSREQGGEQRSRAALYIVGIAATVLGGLSLFLPDAGNFMLSNIAVTTVGVVVLLTTFFNPQVAKYVTCVGVISVSGTTLGFGVKEAVLGYVVAIVLAGVLISGRVVPVIALLAVSSYLMSTYFSKQLTLVGAIGVITSLLICTVLMSIFAESQRRIVRLAEGRASDIEAALAQLHQKQGLEQQTGQAIVSVMQTLGSVSRDQLSGAQEQVAALGQVTTTIEELSQTAMQIAEAAAEVGHAAEGALVAVDASQSAVNDGLRAMMQIRVQVQQIVQRTIALNERIQSISDVVGVVASIAAETHLLALNASIEAAGAGSAGERFAVVAAQVKKLARRSQEEVVKIREIVQDIQRANVMSVMATEQGLKDSDKGAEQARIAAEANLEVIDTVSATTMRTKAIVLATQQQRSASNQVVETMRLLRANAGSVVKAASNIDSSINELSGLAVQLGAIIQTINPPPPLAPRSDEANQGQLVSRPA